jgi:hypothetical protein
VPAEKLAEKWGISCGFQPQAAPLWLSFARCRQRIDRSHFHALSHAARCARGATNLHDIASLNEPQLDPFPSQKYWTLRGDLHIHGL